MTWNILFGGEDRFERILALLERVRPDVAVLQECLGWEDGVRLARAARAIGAPAGPAHAVLGHARPRGSGRRFHVAIASRFPLSSVTTHADPARVGHCILEAHIEAPGGRVVVLGTHFDAHGEDERVRDARTLCDLAPRRRVLEERVLVAGDLNALTRRDPYPADLEALLRAAGTTKYGLPPRFDTMEILDRQGFVDLLHRDRSAPRRSGAPWVTAVRSKGGVRIEYRTDYLLASPALALGALETSVLDSDGASDHEPVIARFAA
jgi:exodeoxyribonuclease III